MRYVKGHGQQTRNRIVENASYGLRESGADGMSVADLMKLVGLTHGGFYSHFDSREALFIEAVALAMDQTVAGWQQLVEALPIEERLDAFVGGYLSARHRDNRARGCVLPALGADIARSSPKARQTFAKKFEEMIDSIVLFFPEASPGEARQIATSTLATMLGSMVLARASGDKALSGDILEAGRQALRRQPALRKSGKPRAENATARQRFESRKERS
ncbi:MAG: TetR/AcrR family transcriptional regulator [Bradyrhizobium sp.]